MGFNFRLTETHMNVAKEYALLSRATRNKVGAILVDENNERILMCGYNGTPPNFDNTCEELINGELVTKKEVLHAEANLILFCAKHGIPTKNKILYSTLALVLNVPNSYIPVAFNKLSMMKFTDVRMDLIFC